MGSGEGEEAGNVRSSHGSGGAPLAVDSERGNQRGPQVSSGQCSCREEREERKKQELEVKMMSKVGDNSFRMGSN